MLLALFLFAAVPSAYAEDKPADKPVVTEKQADAVPLEIMLLSHDNKAAGNVKISEATKGFVFEVSANGLAPGWHGVHIHAFGNCSDHEHFNNAGGHMKDEGQTHGFFSAKGPHTGDLPNMWIGTDGSGKAAFYTPEISLASLKDADGSALMIHAGEDDYKTDPAGNSGDRVICGVISVAESDKK